MVSSPLPEIVRFNENHNGVVTIAEGPEEFGLAVAAILDKKDSTEDKVKRITIAEENTWPRAIENMSFLIRRRLDDGHDQM